MRADRELHSFDVSCAFVRLGTGGCKNRLPQKRIIPEALADLVELPGELKKR
jgi:hypothetical protein